MVTLGRAKMQPRMGEPRPSTTPPPQTNHLCHSERRRRRGIPTVRGNHVTGTAAPRSDARNDREGGPVVGGTMAPDGWDSSTPAALGMTIRGATVAETRFPRNVGIPRLPLGMTGVVGLGWEDWLLGVGAHSRAPYGAWVNVIGTRSPPILSFRAPQASRNPNGVGVIHHGYRSPPGLTLGMTEREGLWWVGPWPRTVGIPRRLRRSE